MAANKSDPTPELNVPTTESEDGCKTCRQISIDIFLSLIFFLPLIILWWAGTWQLMELYLFQNSLLHSSYASLAIGSFICFAGHLFQPVLEYAAANYTRFYPFILRIFVYVYAVGYISYFRGVWKLCDCVMQGIVQYKVKVLVLSLTLGCCELLLLISRTNGSPFSICMDSSPIFYKSALLFDTQLSRQDIGAFIADVIVTFFGITTIIVFLWLSIWEIIEDNINPHDKFKSLLICLICGYILCIIFLCIPNILNWIARQLCKIHPFIAFLFLELVKLLALVSTLLVWIGAWKMLDEYVLGQVPWRSWVMHYGSFVVLAVLQVCTILAPLGSVRDDTALDHLYLDWSIGYVGNIPVLIQERIVTSESQTTNESIEEESRPLLPQV